MTRRTTETFRGYDRPDVIVTLPAQYEHPGVHRGELNAWAVDDQTGDWWGMCDYTVSPGMTYFGWVQQGSTFAARATCSTTPARSVGSCSTSQVCPERRRRPA